jgi:hypothetical protein
MDRVDVHISGSLYSTRCVPGCSAGQYTGLNSGFNTIEYSSAVAGHHASQRARYCFERFMLVRT